VTDDGERREYRMAELAEAAGITVRTLRFYRERRLIRPPRREGRIAWYDDTHLTRLRTISALLERGHTLTGIAELAEAFDHGRDVGDLLGVGGPTEETPVRLTPEALADVFGAEATADNLAAALDLGYLGTDGGEIVHISRRLLDVSAALVREGIPLADVLRAGRRVREHAEDLAELFTTLILAQGRTEQDLQRLRPLAKSVVEAELSMALDRRAPSGRRGATPSGARETARATPSDPHPPTNPPTPGSQAPEGAEGAQPPEDGKDRGEPPGRTPTRPTAHTS
jgi:DNA-binding transcriptional MerR regulator